ncbi:hypothetical protein M0R45_021328 [Rubus argutus]|uniref:Helicase C-terminal domain-containing protein n=1 Tax=Rubus argutus TaxID=59490 RepID=A0AAW1XDC8_RUBAR
MDYLLSGTPALSRSIELFKQLEALYPDVYKNVHEYGKRYCKGGTFGIYQGASNHEELHNLMKATAMIRRLKNDVLSELPVKRRQQVFLDLAERDMKQINALFCEIDTDSAEAKIPAVLDYLGTVIEAGYKFLVFAHHQSMIDAIHQFLLKKKVGCIRIDGSIPTVERQAYVTEFQEKDSVKAAVLSIKAGGIGLTLTAASTVIFAELLWTPGDLIQAEDRAHRIGQYLVGSNFQSLAYRESLHQAIIPGLPDDLALRCLAKLSHGYHGLLETVSKAWRDLIRSSDYANYKARERWCGNWLFVLTEGSKNEWVGYDPEADRWHPLPKIPTVHAEWKHYGFSSISVCNRFFRNWRVLCSG